MPVNYERAPWDKDNSLMVRLVNQRLADNQRKATFIDTFLHSPRVCAYWPVDPTAVCIFFIVLHPSYPVITALAYEGVALTVPPGEYPPNYTSTIHGLFDWSRAPCVELSSRDADDPLEMEFLNRYLVGQYQDAQGRDTLLQSNQAGTTWQTTGLFSAYMRAISLFNDGVRQESTWSLDTLWANRKFLLGREYEREPSTDFQFYLPPDPENINVEVEEQTKSEAYFPRLPGYHVDYIDSLGVFAPNNYGVNPIISDYVYRWLIEQRAPANIVDIFDRSTVLQQGITATSLQQVQEQSELSMFTGIPVIGGFIGQGMSLSERATRMNNTYFWPRAYAFGRQFTPAPTPNEMYQLYTWYNSHRSKNGGLTFDVPLIKPVQSDKFRELVKILLARKYINSEDFIGWI